MKIFYCFIAAVIAVFWATSSGVCADLAEGSADSSTTIVIGKIVDVSCYVSNASNDWQDKACVVKILKVGQPAGILEEETGKLYVVAKTPGYPVNLAAELIPYAAEKVRVKGIVNTRAGVNMIEIKDIERVK